MDLSKIFSKVFLWMFIGLAVTFVTGSVVSNNPTLLEEIFSTGWYWLIIVLEFGTVIFLSARIHKMSATTAKVSFILYSFLTGLTFSMIFILFEMESIMMVFLITAVLMLVLSLIGYKTKMDLTKFGTFLLVILIGVVILSIVNIFMGLEQLEFIITIVSLIVFMCFVAYDVQKIKRMYEYNALPEENLAIIGALELYLDFINIFLDLLKLFGNSND